MNPLERVIEEQQERIDRLEKQAHNANEFAKAEFRRYQDLFSAMQNYMDAANRFINPKTAPEKDLEFFLKSKYALREAAAKVGYCWRCEHYGCVCSDCECED